MAARLPSRIQPLWGVLKRIHRVVTGVVGRAFRLAAPLIGDRAVPRRATLSSLESARIEPEAVTVHPVAPATELVRQPAIGDPAGHWVFRQSERADIPAEFLVEVRGGRLVGEFGALVTPGGVLDYETSTYFGIERWTQHPLYLRPTLGTTEHIDGTVLSLTTRGTSDNYYHFLYDAIGRYGTFEAAFGDRELDAIVVPHHSGYMRQFLELAGIEGPFVQPRPGHTISADRLLVPSNTNYALDGPPAVVDRLRTTLRPRGRTADLPRRLYLSRGDRPNTRRYVQEAEAWPHLVSRGFVKLDPGSLSVQEQIDIFHGAEVVVAPHGAALTNITFCQPSARVLEMFANDYVRLGLWTIADAIGLTYRYLVADGSARPGNRMFGVLEDISIPAARVVAAVDQLLAE